MCSAFAEPIKYPDARREDRIDKLHGVDVADPYRWLEDDVRKSADVKAWVEAQSKVTSNYLLKGVVAIPCTPTKVWMPPGVGMPFCVTLAESASGCQKLGSVSAV